MKLDNMPWVMNTVILGFFAGVLGMAGWLLFMAFRIGADIMSGSIAMTWEEAGLGALVAAGCIGIAALAGYGLFFLSTLLNWSALAPGGKAHDVDSTS